MGTFASGEKPAPSEAIANRRNPPNVGALAPEQVAEPARHQHEHGRGDQVRENHPHEREQAAQRQRFPNICSAMINVPSFVAASSMPRLVQDSAHHVLVAFADAYPPAGCRPAT